MSVAAEILKYPILKIARARVHRHVPKIIEAPVAHSPSETAMVSLVRHTFFPASGVHRSRILFASAGLETNISSIAQRASQALAEISGMTVALVERSSYRAPVASVDEDECERKPRESSLWRRYASQISERVWRLKADVLPLVTNEHRSFESNLDLPFDFFLMAAVVSDGMLPLMCRNCEGAVLALTANRTRKESALRAKRVLQQCDAELLGTVLEGRKFPIPESIYRRL